MTQLSEDIDAKRSVLGRAFDILDCFAGGEPEQTISSLCEGTGLPPATVHRMLATLVEWGAVERSSRGHYRLGMRLWRLGWGVPGARHVRDVARPFMVDLYTLTHEIVVLGSRDGDKLLMVDQIAGHSCGLAWESSRRVPLGTIAPGIVILAHLPVTELRDLLATSDLGLPTGLADSEFVLLQRLAEVRRTGVAVTANGERSWVSSAVYDAEGSIRSTISVVVPTGRVNAGAHGRVVAQAARAVSRGLGARTTTPLADHA